MNILLRELKSNRRSLLIWGTILAVLSFAMLSIYPTFAADAEMLDEFLALYPEGFKKVFGLDRISMATAIGFFAVEMYFMILIFGSMFATIISSAMLAKEEDEKTIEFLLAKPVTRNQVITGKLISLLLYLLVFNFGIGIVTFIGFEIFAGEYSRNELVRLLIAPILVHLTFAGLGLLLSLFFTRKKSMYSAGIGLVLAVYFLNVIATLSENFQWLRYLSPFYYMDAADILIKGRIDPFYGLILLATASLAIGFTYFLYNRRDITI